MHEMTSNTPTNAAKHITSKIACAHSMIHKRLGHLIGQNGVVCTDVMLFPAFCRTKRHFGKSNEQVVDTSIINA